MAVTTGSTNIDAQTTMISVAGTAAEVRAELALGADIEAKKAGLRWKGRPQDIIYQGTDGTACVVLYFVSKP